MLDPRTRTINPHVFQPFHYTTPRSGPETSRKMTLYYPNYSSSFGCGLTPDKWILANHATKRLVSSMCKRIGGTSNWNPNGCTFGWPSSIFTACFLSEERLTAFNRKRNGSEPDTTHERQAHQTDCPRHITNTRRPPWDFGGPVEDSRFGPSRHQFRTPTVRAVHCGSGNSKVDS